MSVLVCNRKFCEASVYSEIIKLWNNIEKDINDVKCSEKFAVSGISTDMINYLENVLNYDFRKYLEYVSIAKNIPITKKTSNDLKDFKVRNIISAISFTDVIFADIEHIIYLNPKLLHRIDHFKLIELCKIKDLLFTWKNNTLKKIDSNKLEPKT